MLDLAAELMKGGRQFAGNVAAADDGNSMGTSLEIEKAVRTDARLRTGDFRQRRLAPGGDHDVSRTQALTAYLDGMRIHEAGSSSHIRHALGCEIAFVDSVQAQHVGIALALQFRPVARTHFDVEAVVACI